MAVDAFIWFSNAVGGADFLPKGESLDETFKSRKAFELKDFSFSVKNKSTLGSATGGAGGGKIEFEEFEIKKPTDSASPIFFRNCAAGMHYDTVHIAIRKAGAQAGVKGGQTGMPYLVFIFGTVFTTGISWDGPGDEGPNEKIKFAYGQLKIVYWPQDEKGTRTKGTVEQYWSQMTNKNEFTAKAEY